DVYTAKVGQKVEVDTVKPDVQLLSAERVGDEVQVRWEVREAHPNWATLKLDYRVGDASEWTPVGVLPGERGTAKFRPPTGGDGTVRLRLADLAENEGAAEKVVPGAPGVTDRAVVGAAAAEPGPRPDPRDRVPPAGSSLAAPLARTPAELTAASKPAP